MKEQLREKLQELLQKPLEKMNSNNVQEIFKEIAENLFNNFALECGKTKSYFTEIEFYYYKEGVWCDSITYDRNKYKVGDLFYHLSGVDICFDCNNSEYGGILIRSMKNDKKEIINGPHNCQKEMLNSCKNDKMPRLVYCQQPNSLILFSERINLGKKATGEYRNCKLRAVLCDELFKGSKSKYLYKPQMIKEYLSGQNMSEEQKQKFAKEKLGYELSIFK